MKTILALSIFFSGISLPVLGELTESVQSQHLNRN